MKKCRVCEKEFDLSLFSVRSGTNKLRNECIYCLRKIKIKSARKCGRKIDSAKNTARVDRWRKKNPEKTRAASALRRAREKKATPKWLDNGLKLEIREKFKLAVSLEIKSGKKFDVDHIVPLAGSNVCGLHVPWNMQVITKKENQRKHNKLTI